MEARKIICGIDAFKDTWYRKGASEGVFKDMRLPFWVRFERIQLSYNDSNVNTVLRDPEYHSCFRKGGNSPAVFLREFYDSFDERGIRLCQDTLGEIDGVFHAYPDMAAYDHGHHRHRQPPRPGQTRWRL